MKTLKHLLIGAVAASTLAACGGSDDGDNITIVTPTPTPTPAPTPTPTTTPTPTPTPTPTTPTPTGCDDVVEADFVSFENDCSVGVLSGNINSDYTLTSDIEWRIFEDIVTVGSGNVIIENDSQIQAIKDAGVELTIEAGTQIRGTGESALLVTRGSKLFANGTADAPITFSSADDNFDGSDEWGGVIIQGFAPQYGLEGTGPCFIVGDEERDYCNVTGEGGTDVRAYGGNFVDDNSGSLTYVRIAEGGASIGANNEINGLTLQGVGYGTTVEYIQVHGNLDDGIEWFGGTVNAKYLVLTNNDDDDIDFDEGYQGNIQYAIVQKDPNKAAPSGSNDPRGIEANSSDGNFVPETEAVLANITVIGGPAANFEDEANDVSQQPGMRLRGAVQVDIYNSSVQGFDTGCIRIDDADTNGDGTNDRLSTVNLTNVVADCVSGIYAKDRQADNNDDEDSNITSATLSVSPTYAVNAALLDAPTEITAVDNGSNFEFDSTNYIGAVDPTAAEGWWEGWIIPDSLNTSPLPDTSADFVDCNDELTECTIDGNIDQDYTLVKGVDWRLSIEALVGSGNAILDTAEKVADARDNGATLTVEPGVHVKAFDNGALIVTRGSKLEAAGTAAHPITFSSADDDFNGLGQWGGVIVQGFAPQYGQEGTGICDSYGIEACRLVGEGGTVVGEYGGIDVADNSGTLRYVRIAEAGKVAGADNEINGLTLQGVGYGTTVEYIQVHNNLDDGVEWFGGTVNVKYLVLTGNDDDDIDFDEGYQGNIQYAIIQKDPETAAPEGSNDPRGIEANSSDAAYVSETQAALANITIVGGPAANFEDEANDIGQQPGMRLRGAVSVDVYNSSVQGFDAGCIRIDDADSGGNGTADKFSVVNLTNVIGDCESGFYTNDRIADSEINTSTSTLTYLSTYAIESGANLGAPESITAVDNGSGFIFDNTSYIGAVDPEAESGWWEGWTIEDSLVIPE